jgi:hypothetical protein
MAGNRGNEDLPQPGLRYIRRAAIRGPVRPTPAAWSIEIMSTTAFEIRSELRGGHWVAWIVRTPDGKPDQAILLVGRTKAEAEQRANDWANGPGK